MTKKGVCRFKKIPEPLTVGDVFEMHCEWPLLVILSSPVRVEFDHQEKKNEHDEGSLSQRGWKQNQEHSPYSLFVLDTVSILPGKGVFKVTSYHTGYYNVGFKLVSDRGVLEVKPVSWKVDSVIPQEKKETIQPYPPYGPWKDSLPFWYWPLGILTLLGLISFIALKMSFFVKRKKKVQEVNNRLKNKSPFREFIGQLNLLVREVRNREGKEIIKKLNTDFRLFLENEFFIFALDEKPEKIMWQLKKYYPKFYKECSLLNFFTEIRKLSSEKINFEDCDQMLDMAREIAIATVERERRR